jgi:putative oxidoreductase
MKTALYGRLVFGASSMLFGVVALMWHDADTWQSMYRILRLPLGTIAGDVLMLALIVGGIGLVFAQTARLGSTILGVVYALFSLSCVPGIVAAPRTYVSYGAFFEQFSLVCGALAVYAITEPNTTRAAVFGRAARIGLGLCAVSFTLAQIFYLKFTASLVPAWIPPSRMFWTILTTVAFALAAIAILVNRQARLATNLMTLMLALFGVLVWIPQVVMHPEAHGNWSEFALNFMITGAAWMVADSLGTVPAQVRPNRR